MSLLIKKGRLRWLGDVECKDDADWAKCCMEMEVDRTCQREGNPRKTCWDGVMEDMKSFGLSQEYAQVRNKSTRKTRVLEEHRFPPQICYIRTDGQNCSLLYPPATPTGRWRGIIKGKWLTQEVHLQNGR